MTTQTAMYSTCLFCHADLGANEVVERFPVGRRLAFDSEKGRLWVVCRKCERWNLTPLEERWEAIEDCERLFSNARLRVATDNIGLARLREGLELVRVGSALRPEFAHWRYGDQFGKRRRKHVIYSVAGAAAFAGLVMVGPGTGIIAGGGWGMWQGFNALVSLVQKRRPRLRIGLPGEDKIVTLRKDHLDHTELSRDDNGWLLRLSYDPGDDKIGFRTRYKMLDLRGNDALRVAGQVLPKINAKGANERQVKDAVELVSQYPDHERLFKSQARSVPSVRLSHKVSSSWAAIGRFPTYVKLALEMATHEEQERRAMEGELALLAAAWRQAEEVAKIADEMFLPPDTSERLEKLKARDAARGTRDAT